MKKSSLLTPKNLTIVKDYYKYLKGQRYSNNTCKLYGSMITEFLLYYGGQEVKLITNRNVEQFNENLIIKRRLSISYQRQFIGAMKLFAKFYHLPALNIEELSRPKKQFKLPSVLSQEEVLALLQKTRNIKHKTILALIYSAGLRISELVNLRLSDIDLNRKQIRIFQGKGRRDRYVILPESFLMLYSNYLEAYTPKFRVVESIYGGLYSTSSIRAVLRRSCELAGITKKVTPHTLRHSYATHLLENGVDIRYIQELLGHKKTETTMIYTHVQRKDLVKIKSPLDLIIEQRLTTQNKLLPGNNEDNF
jgi:integrase/recombinase XerD